MMGCSLFEVKRMEVCVAGRSCGIERLDLKLQVHISGKEYNASSVLRPGFSCQSNHANTCDLYAVTATRIPHIILMRHLQLYYLRV
jgi:hypothetical protein